MGYGDMRVEPSANILRSMSGSPLRWGLGFTFHHISVHTRGSFTNRGTPMKIS